MTITITAEQFYIGIIVFLSIVQMFQWSAIKKLEKECQSIWKQVEGLANLLASSLVATQKELEKKQDK